MKTNIRKLLAFATVVALAASSCSKKDDDKVTNPPYNNEEEVITTLILNFTDFAGIQPNLEVLFRDPDGNGGNGPDRFDTIRLAPNTVYLVSITLLNEATSPVDTISNEVLEEAVDHLFCFAPSSADVSIVRTDSDGTYEIGLQSKWTTGNAGNGTVQVTLKHQPDIKDGSCDPGETDVDVTFVTEIL